MKKMRIFLPLVVAVVVAASPASALRSAQRPLLMHRTAVSGYLGVGIPVGEFASEREGDGNHESGPLDWSIEIEHFVARTMSLGFSAANTTYEDKTIPGLETHLSTYSGFLRAVIPTATEVRPYLRFGMGAVQVQFQDPTLRVDADYEFSLQIGGGLLWLPSRWVGVNTQVLYYYGSTEDAFIAETQPEPTIVGFDVKYFAFSAGVSIFFP